MSTSKSIHVDDDIHAVLAALKGDYKTFNELFARLVAQRRESVHD